MPGLTEPLTQEQQILVDLLWSTFIKHERFPHFFYVNYRMRKHGYDAVTVLNTFPVVGRDQVTHGYRAVGWWGADHNPDRNGPVHLTMAGLYHVRSHPTAALLARGLLTYMQELTRRQEAILDSPFQEPDIDVDLAEIAKQVEGASGHVQLMALIAEHEWPGIRFHLGSLTGRLGALHDADFDALDPYLAAVTAALAPTPPLQALAFSEPRALVRALNFLDITSELVLGKALVPRPPLDRSSLLALDADDEAGFHAGLVVLTDVLRDLHVPGQAPTQGLLRLENYLTGRLPAIDRTVVGQAVQLLDRIRVIRNSAIHPKSSANLHAAHQALGLPFPVRDFTAAWDSVRAHAERAISILQEAIQAARQ